ncbi:hypothetical protein QG37_07657 [Candidozyma auris]|nr:hypothetical protein QG37_07657 [[Candida] auris]
MVEEGYGNGCEKKMSTFREICLRGLYMAEGSEGHSAVAS